MANETNVSILTKFKCLSKVKNPRPRSSSHFLNILSSFHCFGYALMRMSCFGPFVYFIAATISECAELTASYASLLIDLYFVEKVISLRKQLYSCCGSVIN